MDINAIARSELLSTNIYRLDYRETALKLQKEWNVEDPQVFDFAPHVRDNALVAVLQRGLLYHDSERKSLEVCLQREPIDELLNHMDSVCSRLLDPVRLCDVIAWGFWSSRSSVVASARSRRG